MAVTKKRLIRSLPPELRRYKKKSVPDLAPEVEEPRGQGTGPNTGPGTAPNTGPGTGPNTGPGTLVE